jgi:tight adherence protein B
MGAAALTALAALGGGLVAVAARDALIAAPQITSWVSAAVAPLGRAGREGYAPSTEEQRRLALLGSAAILGLAVLIAGPGPLAVAAAAGPSVAGWLVTRRRERYRRAVERSVPDVATAIADALSGGRSVRGALSGASSSLEGPAAVELARLAAELGLGASTADALAGMRRRLRSARVDALAMALLSQQGAGGDLAGLMRRVAGAAAERDRVDDEARTATTQARFTGLLVVALPAGAALFAELLEPGFISQVLGEPVAAAMLIAAAGLQLAGFAAIRRLGQPAE